MDNSDVRYRGLCPAPLAVDSRRAIPRRIILETNSLISVGEMLRRSGRLFDRFEGQSIAGQLVYLSDYR